MERKYGVTFEKGIELLLLFGDEQLQLTVGEISARLGIPTSTVYRFLKVLKENALVEACEAPGRYRLGLRLLDLARLVRSNLSVANLALPIMQELSRVSGETTLLTIRYGLQAVCAERVESTQTLRLSFERGRPMPLHAGASSLVLLAFAEEEEITAVLQAIQFARFSESTITDPIALRERLRQIRKQGYAFSQSEVDIGATAVAAPIYDAAHGLAAGISVVGPSQRLSEEVVHQIIGLVVAAARQISEMAAQKGVFHT